LLVSLFARKTGLTCLKITETEAGFTFVLL
jgi:hypothetical protein